MNCFSLLQNIIPSRAFKIWKLKGTWASCSHPAESVKIRNINMKRTIRRTPFPMPCHESVCSRIPQVVAVAPCIYLIAALIGKEVHSLANALLVLLYKCCPILNLYKERYIFSICIFSNLVVVSPNQILPKEPSCSIGMTNLASYQLLASCPWM